MPTTTPKPLSVRPSKMELTRACLGSVAAQAPYPWESSDAADRGRALHDAMALLFQAGDTPMVWSKIDDSLSENPLIKKEDIDRLPEVYRLGRSQEPIGQVITLVESPLDLTFIGMDGGKPDLVFISLEHKTAVIIDWKFGSRPVEDPKDNAQMQDYGIGIIEKVRKEHGITLESVEGVIIQPFGFKVDDWVRSHTWSTDELRAIAKADQAVAKQAKAPGAPVIAGPHCDAGFCSARKAGKTKSYNGKEGQDLAVCPAYAAYKEMRAFEKTETHKMELNTVTEGTPITVAPDQPLDTPVVVIAAEVIARMEEKKNQIMSMQVVDEASAQAVGRLSKEIRADIRLIDENRKNLGQRFYDFWKKINAAAAPAIKSGEDAAAHGDGLATAYKQRLAAEVQRLKDEEERKRREVETARLKAEADARAQAQAAADAARKAQAAIEAAENAKGKAAKAKAEAESKKAQEEALAAARAMEEQKKRDEEIKAKAEFEARELEAARMRAEEEEKKKMAGYRTEIQVTSTIEDVTLVPKKWQAALLQVNQKALDLMVKQGVLKEDNTEGWLKIKRETVAARSR